MGFVPSSLESESELSEEVEYDCCLLLLFLAGFVDLAAGAMASWLDVMQGRGGCFDLHGPDA